MKTKLLLLISLFAAEAFAQSPINSFYNPEDRVTYFVVTSGVPLDQTPSGANVNWDFSQLLLLGTSEVQTVAPTAMELGFYPNSTAVTVTESTLGTENYSNKIFSRTQGTTVSITGANTSQIQLSFDVDNATLGAFPLTYGYTNSDGVSGNYEAEGGYSGTFTGNSTTAVDAYGTLTTNIGSFPAGTNVTRLKTTQNINLDYLFFTNVGTVTQTIYSYYDDNSVLSTPIFRSTSTSIIVPTLNVNQSAESLESFQGLALGNQDYTKLNATIAPNPVNDFLNIQTGNNEIIRNIKITDVNGRIVVESNVIDNSLNVSQLQKGIYLATIKTNNGQVTQKIVKQ